jgi:hypothetical protein
VDAEFKPQYHKKNTKMIRGSLLVGQIAQLKFLEVVFGWFLAKQNLPFSDF